MTNISILEGLKKPLLPENINWMPKQTMKWGDSVKCVILAYKDARVDMERLDEVCGGLWQNEYKRDSQGVLQCGISVYDTDLNEWITRYSNGVPSDFESAKGEYSDAFKRAGFMWGIGRELYGCPKIIVDLQDREWKEINGKPKATGYLKPNEWKWTFGENFEGLKAQQKFGNEYKDRFNSKPYAK